MSRAIVGSAMLAIEPTRTAMLMAIATASMATARCPGGSPSWMVVETWAWGIPTIERDVPDGLRQGPYGIGHRLSPERCRTAWRRQDGRGTMAPARVAR